MIDTNTGTITFLGQNDKVYRGMTKSNFVDSSLSKVIQQDNSHKTASIYALIPQTVYDKIFKISIIFDQSDKLFMVQMYSVNDKVKSWEDWSEDFAKKDKDLNDGFLAKHIGKPPYKYNWGVIDSQYDPRSGSSVITIRYF